MTFSFTLTDLLNATEAYDSDRHRYHVEPVCGDSTDVDYSAIEAAAEQYANVQAWVKKLAEEVVAYAQVALTYFQEDDQRQVYGLELPFPPPFADTGILQEVVDLVNGKLKENKPLPIRLRLSVMDPASTQRFLQVRYGDPDMPGLLFAYAKIPDPA